MTLKFLLGLSLVFFAIQNTTYAEENQRQQGEKRINVAIVVNRQATEADSFGGKQVVPTNYKQLLEHKYEGDSKKEAQRRLEAFQAAIKKLNDEQKLGLDKTPFTIEYTKDEKEMVYGEVVVIMPTGYRILPVETIPVRDPEDGPAPFVRAPGAPAPVLAPMPREVKPVTRNSLVTMATSNVPASTIAPNLISWTISAPRESLNCKETDAGFAFEDAGLQQVFTAAKITRKADLSGKNAQDALSTVARKLDRRSRFELFLKRSLPCLTSVYSELWSVLAKERAEYLAWDLKYWLEAAHAKKNKVHFEGRIEGLVFDKDAPEIPQMLAYVENVLLQFKSGELAKLLPRGFREWASWDTATPDEASRLEPNDFLTYFVAHHHFGHLVSDTTLDTVSRNVITRTAIQHALVPERYAQKLFVYKSSDAKTKQDGVLSYFLYCAGESLSSQAEKPKVQGDRLLSYFAFSEPELRDLRKANGSFAFVCGNTHATMTSPVEKLHVPLFDPIDHKFTISKDKKIKAVMTFELSQVAPKELVDAMKKGIGLAFPGYKAKDDQPVKDLKKEFLAEMLDTDFYFPANHQMQAGQFGLSVDKGVKITFVREKGGVTTELIVFLPPSEANGTQPTTITDKDLVELFKKRRAQKETKRLTVLNMACNSFQCVPHWMSAYKKSLDENMKEDEAKTASKDVIVVIGAQRSFQSGSAAAYLSHARYPFAALDFAAEEKTVRELLEFLTKDEAAKDTAKYSPKSNAGEKDYFDIKAQEDKLNIVITTSTNERLVY